MPKYLIEREMIKSELFKRYSLKRAPLPPPCHLFGFSLFYLTLSFCLIAL